MTLSELQNKFKPLENCVVCERPFLSISHNFRMVCKSKVCAKVVARLNRKLNGYVTEYYKNYFYAADHLKHHDSYEEYILDYPRFTPDGTIVVDEEDFQGIQRCDFFRPIPKEIIKKEHEIQMILLKIKGQVESLSKIDYKVSVSTLLGISFCRPCIYKPINKTNYL